MSKELEQEGVRAVQLQSYYGLLTLHRHISSTVKQTHDGLEGRNQPLKKKSLRCIGTSFCPRCIGTYHLSSKSYDKFRIQALLDLTQRGRFGF